MNRIKSIDIFRALTVLLMIFVNNLWNLHNIPGWLEHSKPDVDFLGLADIVFPCFLFILGMSIPYAINNRRKKGESDLQICKHIALRTIALVVLGLFTVNSPDYSEKLSGLSREWYVLMMLISFFLVWNSYEKDKLYKKITFTTLQIAGICTMIFLAIIYRGEGHNNEVTYFGIKWWGILGLIGWTYFAAALIYLFSKKSPILWASVGLLFFTLFNIAANAEWISNLTHLDTKNWFIGNGAFHSFTLTGVIASLVLTKYHQGDNKRNLYLFFIISAMILLLAGIISRNFFIISKIWATPTWVFICSGLACFIFVLTYWLTDVKGYTKWSDIIRPAGTSTLTCYLMPDVFNCIIDILHLKLPAFMQQGTPGLLKTFLFALMVIVFVGLLERIKIKLKI